MNRFGTTAIATIIALVACGATMRMRAAADTVDDVKSLVVWIHCHSDGQTLGHLAGLIVGEDPTRLYIATSNHARTSCSSHDYRVVFFGTTQYVRAELMDFHDASLDLTFLTLAVREAPRLSWPMALLGRSTMLATRSPVRALGFPAQHRWHLSSPPDLLQTASPDLLTFDSATAAPGSSGGPLLDDSGHIVGLMKARQANVAQASPIEPVIKRLLDWRVPVLLHFANGGGGGRDPEPSCLPIAPEGTPVPSRGIGIPLPRGALRVDNTWYVLPAGWTRTGDPAGNTILTAPYSQPPYGTRIIIEPGQTLSGSFRTRFEQELERSRAFDIGVIEEIDLRKGFRGLLASGLLQGQVYKERFYYFAANPGNRFEQIALLPIPYRRDEPEQLTVFREFLKCIDYENIRAIRPQ
jgi:hypothetical protein